MIQIKKTILTLVALLAVTTGAWADDYTITLPTVSNGSVVAKVSDVSVTSAAADATVSLVATPDAGYKLKTISATYNISETISSGADTRTGTYFSVSGNNYNYGWRVGNSAHYTLTISSLSNQNLSQVVLTVGGPKTATQRNISHLQADHGTLSATGTTQGNTITITGINSPTVTVSAPGSGNAGSMWSFTQAKVDDGSGAITLTDTSDDNVKTFTMPSGNVTVSAEFEASASSGPEVAWTAATKTGTFTMPGGNVTLEPEYYPQATVADGAVTAADADARATTDDPLVKVDATKLTGAKKLMYFVSNSGTPAPAYDAEGWTDQLPTAEGFTQQGIVYVWYYPVGTDEGVDGATATYSDGDICLQSITARIAPEPTYAVTFAEGTDPNEWTASPNAGVKKGTEVTVTYTGKKKVLGVKAEKKAAAPAGPVTYTNLKGGEVLHVGDKITETEGKFRYTHHSNPQSTDYYSYIQSFNTYEVLRADVAYEDYNYKYTESPDGQYYVLKCTYFDDYEEEWFTAYYFNQDLPVTGTSDGITVTLDGQDGSQRNLYTFWVHEPNQ